MPTDPQLAISYAALILAGDGVEITADKMRTLLKAANIEDVEPIWTIIFAKALKDKDMKELVTAVQSAEVVEYARLGRSCQTETNKPTYDPYAAGPYDLDCDNCSSDEDAAFCTMFS